jgi:hypothetical protein
MSTSNTSAKGGCGCGGSTAGTALASPCNCAGAGCAACATEGYVRPRFFAGQLLTEDDLQALADYVVSKNRLHNRHFMGDGVVCGLAVTCNPCGGGKVVVHPGHALDCCGNDLVLECAVELDAIAMVRDLRRNQAGGVDCGDPCAERKPNGDALPSSEANQITRHYDLYLRYSEQSSDPVTPYATDEPCAATGCEFTRVREGVRFELRCVSDMEVTDGFIARVLACLKGSRKLTQALSKVFESTATGADVAAAREAFLDVIDQRASSTDCQLRASVAAIGVPAQGSSLDPARNELVVDFVRLVRDCACQAVLPPCAPCDDNGVLLARIEMRDCLVQSICNLERKFVLTGPAMRYWLPLNVIGDAFEEACCGEIKFDPAPPPPAQTPEQPTTGFVPAMKKVSMASTAGGKDDAASTSTTSGTGGSTAGGKANDAMATKITDYLEKAFGISARDVGDFDAMATNMGKVYKAGGMDQLVPGRLMHMIESLDLGSLGQGASSAQVQRLGEQNKQLQSQLDEMRQRLDRLDGKTPPPPPPAAPSSAPASGTVVKKTRK